MYSTVLFLASPDAIERATGTPDLGRMRVPYEHAAIIDEAGVNVSIATDQGPAPLAPLGHVQFLARFLSRHTVGPACASFDGINRRLAMLPDALEPRNPATDLFGQGACEDLKGWAHYAREALALPEDVALSRLPGVALLHEEKVSIVRAVYAERDGVYPWNCIGARLDEAEAKRASAEADEKARRARAEEAAKRPNAKTLDELGLVGISIDDGTPEHLNFPVLARRTPEELERTAVERHGSSLVFVLRKEELRGLELRPGKLGRIAVTVLPGSDVIAVMPHELQEKTLHLDVIQAGWFFGARGVPARKLSPSDILDPRTPEGAWRARLFREVAKPMAKALVGPMARPVRLFFERGIRGLRLHPDTVRAIYREVVAPLWDAMHPQEWEEKPADLFFTESGEPVPKADVRFIPGGAEHTHAGRPYRVTGTNANYGLSAYEGGTFMAQTETKEFLVTRLGRELVPRPRRALPVTDDVFVALAREALEGKAPWVDVDELMKAPDAKTWASILASFGHERDAWREVIRGVIADKDHVTSAEIEEAIVDAGLFSGTFGNEEHNLVKDLAADLGYEKKQKRFGANPERVYVKRTP